MAKYMVVKIDCEEDHCKTCKYVATTRLGTIYMCCLFYDELYFDENEKLLRCDICKEKIK